MGIVDLNSNEHINSLDVGGENPFLLNSLSPQLVPLMEDSLTSPHLLVTEQESIAV